MQRSVVPVSKSTLVAFCIIMLAGSSRLMKAADPAQSTRRHPPDKRAAEPSTMKAIPLARDKTKSVAGGATRPGGGRPPSTRAAVARKDDVIASLQERLQRQEKLLAAQQEQISRLVATMDELMSSLKVAHHVAEPLPAHPSPQVTLPHAEVAAVLATSTAPKATAGREVLDLNLFASLEPPVLSPFADLAAPGFTPTASGVTPPAPSTTSSPVPSQAALNQTQPYTTRLDTLSREVEGISKGVAGFKFSGDFRLRADGIFRSSDAAAGPEQDMRGRYRARLNFDKGIDQQLSTHFQLGSGRFDNAITDDTDFGGGATRGPIFLTEAWMDYHPNSTVSLRGGKMPEVFQDFTRFMWDEDVRFNGGQESIGKSLGENPLGITRITLRAGQYVLTNPNIQVLPSATQCAASPAPASCAYLQAGYTPGENVRASDLFDEGVFVDGKIQPGWSQYLFGNFVSYRNADQIALGSTSAGYGVFASSQLGVTLPGPLTGTGSATTLPGGGIYTAHQYQIGHLAYRITKEGLRSHREEFPVFLDLQASRNFGTSFLRNAWGATLNVGEIKKAGDVRFLYFYVVKDANSLVSEFTDDQVGTQTGVNIRTHALRFDIGLTKYLQWQNIVYVQNEISSNDPARHFYVPIQEGAGTQFRVQSSLFANF